MNQITISGRLTGEVAERTSASGKNYVTFSIAWNKKDKVLFFQVSAFDNAAEFAKKFLKKGSPVEVTGELDSSVTMNRRRKNIYPISLIGAIKEQ